MIRENSLSTSIAPILQANTALITLILSLILVPIISKLTSYFATSSLREQIEDPQSHEELVLRYSGAVDWYRKGIDLTLHFFERIYGKRKFGSVSFVLSMQIATLYFWSAAILVLILSGIYVNGFTASLQPVVLIYGFLFSVLAALSVKTYFLTGRMTDFLQIVISKLLNNLEHPFFSQIKNFQLNKFAIMQPHQSLVRIILALTAILFFHFSMVKLTLLGFSDFDQDLVGDNSLVGYLMTSMLILLLLTYMILLFRFVVEAGIFYPIFGAVFAGFFFSNDHSNFMILFLSFLFTQQQMLFLILFQLVRPDRF